MIYALIPIALVALWTTFLAYVAIKSQWEFLRPEVKAVGLVVVFAGFILDIALNIVPGLILGFGNLTISQKCKRLGREDSGWRGHTARYLCQNWLNVFDQEHC